MAAPTHALLQAAAAAAQLISHQEGQWKPSPPPRPPPPTADPSVRSYPLRFRNCWPEGAVVFTPVGVTSALNPGTLIRCFLQFGTLNMPALNCSCHLFSSPQADTDHLTSVHRTYRVRAADVGREHIVAIAVARTDATEWAAAEAEAAAATSSYTKFGRH